MNAERTDPATTSEVLFPDRGWRNQSLAELMAEQGILCPQDFDALFGSGSDLWTDDKEFDEFLTWMRHTRTEGR